MAGAGMLAGAAWIAFAGALRHWRGVNETISTLLLTYIGIAILNHIVEGVMRDPASLNKPATHALPDADMIGTYPRHGRALGPGLRHRLLHRRLCPVLPHHVRLFGAHGRRQSARGAARRLAGRAHHHDRDGASPAPPAGSPAWSRSPPCKGRASATLAAGYGYTGILVAFIARQNPLAVIPVAILFGGINASGGLLQRRLDLPDASVLVLQGIIFVVILASETLFGRFRIFRPKEE